MFKINKLLIASLAIIGWFGFVGFQAVWAEPQFGGDVSGVVACTCGDNAGGYYFVVGDPHGDENGGPASYVITPDTDRRDCEPIRDGEEVLGMHNDNDEECRIQVGNACVLVGTGKGVDVYGTSKTDDCDTGLDGDASGDGKVEMITPDGRTADGGDMDDGGPSGGPSQATRHDRHLVTVDGVKADGSGGAVHMETPDHQNYEGANTIHIETSDHRNYEGNNDRPLTSSGKDSGYSPAGAGRPGDGHGSIGGSVGSGGLESPVVLGDQDKSEQKVISKNKTLNNDIGIDEQNEKPNNLWRLIVAGFCFVIGGFFVWRAGMRLMKN